MTALWAWLSGKIAGPLLGTAAVLLAAGLLWQTARIDGLPLLGGGLKAQVAQLRQQVAARDLAAAKARAAAATARATWIAAGQQQARAHLAAAAATRAQIQTIIQKVPVYVGEKSNAGCVINWGAVRLLDAAASGTDPDTVRAAIAPGRPDDAASDVTLSEAVALLAADLGIARDNADQLGRLQAAVP
jgi:predicted amidohydrolase YtcJ